MYIRKIFALILAIALVFGSFSFSFASEELKTTNSNAAAFTDLTGHWAAEAIYKWAGYGIINGFEGAFRPDNSITRGEMAVILDNMMDYQVKASNKFTDLQQGKFYTDAVLKANAAGIIIGDGKTVRPNDKITREEAAVMLSRAFAVKEASSGNTFADASSISDWAKGAVFGMEAKGYLNGYDGHFEPKADITRAAAVTIIDNIVKAYYTTAGTYTENVEGTAVIKVSGVILKDITVSENLIIAEGVAQGDATLDSVTVKGDTVVRGGGENSIHIIGNSSLTSITIQKVDGKIRIVVSDGITIQELEITAGEEIILDGSFGTVNMDAPDATLTVNAGSSVQKVVATAKVSIRGLGAVTEVDLNAGANGSSVTTPNTEITVSSGVSGVTGGGGTPIPAGSSGKNNSSGSDVAESTGGGGGGGGTDTPSPTLTLDESSVRIGGHTVTKSGIYYEIDIDWTDDTELSARVSGANFNASTSYPM
ncbi:MAG TPA: S-layer homology domain-containing protein, partial [Anaerovoracaceae bacterium]|nr:S-layer homology domain-containing protein [Anaerovoracaceae bacterium]